MPVHNFYRPMFSHCPCKQLHIQRQAAYIISSFRYLFPLLFRCLTYHPYTFYSLPTAFFLHPPYLATLIIFPFFYLGMSFFHSDFITDIVFCFFKKFHILEIPTGFPVQIFLVFLYHQRVICMLLFYLFCYLRLRTHGINRYNASFYLYGIQQLWNGSNLI